SDALSAALTSTVPATALNPFVAGSAGSQQLIKSLLSDQREGFLGQTQVANGFIRGPLFALPAGEVHALFGGEYSRDKLQFNTFGAPVAADRKTRSFFGEARAPILSSHSNLRSGDVLAVDAAFRY